MQLAWISDSNSNCNLWKTSNTGNTGGTHTHFFEPQHGLATGHPHKITLKCECGATQVAYGLKKTCPTCTANTRELTNTIKVTKVFSYTVDDAVMGGVFFAPYDCYIEYTNTYDYPFSMAYDLPPFASFASSVVSYAVGPTEAPSLNCESYWYVDYYSDSDTKIGSQTMSWNADLNSYPTNIDIVYTLDTKPAYAVTGAMFIMLEYNYTNYSIEITSNFP